MENQIDKKLAKSNVNCGFLGASGIIANIMVQYYGPRFLVQYMVIQKGFKMILVH